MRDYVNVSIDTSGTEGSRNNNNACFINPWTHTVVLVLNQSFAQITLTLRTLGIFDYFSTQHPRFYGT